jgi:uncharacterized protein YktA (UPF0223 family)
MRTLKRAYNIFKGILRVKRQKEKLARMFYRSRLVQSVLSSWKTVIKQIIVEAEEKARINGLLMEVTEA